MILTAFSRALAQLPDPAFRSVLLRGLGMTLVLFVVLIVGADYAADYLRVADQGWLNWLAQIASLGGFVIVLFLLFPAVASFFIALFLEDIAEAVERRWYPAEPPGRSAPLWPSLVLAARFTGVMLVLNLLALFFLLFPPIFPFVYYILNGYLLSREYFELVSLRHMDAKTVHAARKAGGLRLLTAGVGIAVLMTIPLVNLVAPLLATAVMVHLFKGLQRRGVAI